MRPRFFFSLLALLARPAISDVAFIYPPAFESTTNFSSNIVMVEGEFKVIQWMDVPNPSNARISVTMFQLNGTQFFGNAEYVTQNAAPDTLSTPWTVNTKKNLTVSPMFYFNLFLEGETTSLTNSHYFNITARSTTPTTSSTSSTTDSASTSASSYQTSTSPSPATTTPSTSPPVVISSGLGTGAKVSIGVGVVGAALLGVLAGWLILGRRRKMNNMQLPQPAPAPAHPLVQTSYYQPVKVEQQPQQYPHEVSGESAPPVRYELPPEMRQ
ncbi:hypothetical protein B0O99DRAFT_692908 [Bisporella sp. PMI_857]|nr:hypothetical protein B0O99DRAFT_692908 [Bisporella sp. PMI_857]